MCGPLCDATLERQRSSAVLERLESRNLLVVPLDRRREWYRYHHLFRELLSSELRRREPEMVSELHRRAAEWYEANGMPETAIDHAQAAGDADTVARLVLQLANPVWASGRSDTVLRWMEWFEANHLIERYPAIAVHGALMFALAGRPGDTERWAAAAEATSDDGDAFRWQHRRGHAGLPAGPRVSRWARRDAARREIAWDGLSAASPFRPAMLHAEGLADLLEGDPDRADSALRPRRGRGDPCRRPPVRPRHPRRARHRGDRTRRLDRGRPFAERRAGADAGRPVRRVLDERPRLRVGRPVALHTGDAAEARQLVARAARLRPLLTYALPVVSVQALLEMARTYIALADPAGARAVLRQAADIFRQRPELGNLPDIAEELRAKVDTIRSEAIGASSLTTAELRLLPLLPTHLSFREIGERLFVSRHTVKTQAISIYRKLGVSSRSETIDRMHELGLLEDI